MKKENVRIKEALSAATKLNNGFWEKATALIDFNEFEADESLMMITMVYAKITEVLLNMAKDTNSMHTYSNLLGIKDVIINSVTELSSLELQEINRIRKVVPPKTRNNLIQ